MKTLRDVAEQIMFQGTKIQEILNHYDLRKNKTPDDIRNAVRKGLKKGAGKTEREIDEIEIALSRVLMKRKQS